VLHAALRDGWTVVFCSSKTRAEILHLLRLLFLRIPFISENGGGVSVPEEYLGQERGEAARGGSWRTFGFGLPYPSLVRALSEIRLELGLELRGFSDMTREEVAGVCGLAVEEASRAKAREYDEPFLLDAGSRARVSDVERSAATRGLRLSHGGRFYHLTGENDKGKAVVFVNGLLAQQAGPFHTVGLGDSENDLPMLQAVDHPVLVQKSDGTYDAAVVSAMPRVVRAPGIGPAGWAAVVRDMVSQGAVQRVLRKDR